MIHFNWFISAAYSVQHGNALAKQNAYDLYDIEIERTDESLAQSSMEANWLDTFSYGMP